MIVSQKSSNVNGPGNIPDNDIESISIREKTILHVDILAINPSDCSNNSIKEFKIPLNRNKLANSSIINSDNGPDTSSSHLNNLTEELLTPLNHNKLPSSSISLIVDSTDEFIMPLNRNKLPNSCVILNNDVSLSTYTHLNNSTKEF